MATMYTPGSRRSSNPTYTPFTPTRTAAVNTVPTLEEQLRSQFVAQGAQQQTPGPLSEAIGRGLSTVSGSGADATFGGNAAPGMAGNIGRAGYATSLLGNLTQNPGLSSVGGILGMAGALGSAKSNEEALGVMAGPALSMLGVPSGAIGLAKAAVDSNPTLAVNSLLGLASPQLGLLNGIAGLFGLPSIGEVVSTAFGGGTDSPRGYNVGGSGLTGYGVVGRDTGGGGGRDGGYGGGIGQSGGNAAGVGSAQA